MLTIVSKELYFDVTLLILRVGRQSWNVRYMDDARVGRGASLGSILRRAPHLREIQRHHRILARIPQTHPREIVPALPPYYRREKFGVGDLKNKQTSYTVSCTSVFLRKGNFPRVIVSFNVGIKATA